MLPRLGEPNLKIGKTFIFFAQFDGLKFSDKPIEQATLDIWLRQIEAQVALAPSYARNSSPTKLDLVQHNAGVKPLPEEVNIS